ncbi:MAG: hypothetical protein GF421_02630 [Candidatus Aminicenantes bacterium]|nr:hypothetical protein [Candidatus Aminicenantes bacterium]
MGEKKGLHLQKIPIVLLSVSLLLLFCCRPSPVLLSPFPEKIRTVQGFASLKITGDQGFSRSKFSFLFQLPDKGRIEVFDFLGRTLYQIVIKETQAFLVVPSKRIYWQSNQKDIIDKFIGFRLDMTEVASFLSGQWSELENKRGGQDKDFWIIQRDIKGRVTQGKKQGMRFQVIEHIEDTALIRSLRFHNRFQTGKLNILSIDFNNPAKKDFFSLSFVDGFERKSWEEIRTMMDHED